MSDWHHTQSGLGLLSKLVLEPHPVDRCEFGVARVASMEGSGIRISRLALTPALISYLANEETVHANRVSLTFQTNSHVGAGLTWRSPEVPSEFAMFEDFSH